MNRVVLALGAVAPLALLVACGDHGQGSTDPAPAPAPAATGMATMPPPSIDQDRLVGRAPPPPRRLSCADERGEIDAARLVRACVAVSPATRPPCGAGNSCALIETEIARGCALLGDAAADLADCRPLPESGAAAADVVRRYYDAIRARDFATAWTLWGPDGRPGQTLAAFQAGFARTRSTAAEIAAPTAVEGGAGSIYAEVPVTVTATLEDGRRQRFTGTYIVRRVNGVDGAAPWQRQWHLDTATLRPVPSR